MPLHLPRFVALTHHYPFLTLSLSLSHTLCLSLYIYIYIYVYIYIYMTTVISRSIAELGINLAVTLHPQTLNQPYTLDSEPYMVSTRRS